MKVSKCSILTLYESSVVASFLPLFVSALRDLIALEEAQYELVGDNRRKYTEDDAIAERVRVASSFYSSRDSNNYRGDVYFLIA